MDKIYKVQEIMKWWSGFENSVIEIKSKSKNFIIDLNKEQLPHLLGVQYMNIKENNKIITGRRLYNHIIINNLSDQEIYSKVETNNFSKLNDVANRINTFKEFCEDLDNGYIVERTNEYTNIKSTNFIVKTKDNKFLQLGIIKQDEKDLMIDFIVEDKTRDILETYFTRNDNLYFKDTPYREKIENIYQVKEDKLIPFSFDEEKNKKLLEEYEKNQEDKDSWDKWLKKDKENLTR